VFEGVADGSLPVPIAQKLSGIDAVPAAFRAMEADLGGGKIVVLF
jgi:hypothetical protein